MIELLKKLYYKIAWYSYIVWLEILYCEWNPWALARLNQAWTNYTKTPMYAERKKIKFMRAPKFEGKTYEDYAEQAYVENLEIKLFTSLFTWKDRVKIAFTPFSCGDKHQIPFYLISNWILGVKEN